MLFRLRRSNASPLIGALLAAAALLSPSFAFAQTGPFADLEGAWTGKGVISASDGHSEPIRCRAKYYVSPSGRDLDQQLRCASDTYRFDVNSGLVRQANGEILGRWTETNRNASGSVNARESDGLIVAKIAGPGFTADMQVATRGDRQQVEITPSGSEITSVSIDMHREGSE